MHWEYWRIASVFSAGGGPPLPPPWYWPHAACALSWVAWSGRGLGWVKATSSPLKTGSDMGTPCSRMHCAYLNCRSRALRLGVGLVAAFGRLEPSTDATPLSWVVPQPTASISTSGTVLTIGNHFLIGGLLLFGNPFAGNRFSWVQRTQGA